MDNPPYIIMEYMPNDSLHTYIDKASKGQIDENGI